MSKRQRESVWVRDKTLPLARAVELCGIENKRLPAVTTEKELAEYQTHKNSVYAMLIPPYRKGITIKSVDILSV